MHYTLESCDLQKFSYNSAIVGCVKDGQVDKKVAERKQSSLLIPVVKWKCPEVK